MVNLQDITYFLSKNSNQHPNFLGVQIIFIEPVEAAVTKIILNLKKYCKI